MARRESIKNKLQTQGMGRAPTATGGPAPAASGYVPAPSRRDKVPLMIYVDPAVREQVRAAALRMQVPAQTLVLTALNEFFERNPDLAKAIA